MASYLTNAAKATALDALAATITHLSVYTADPAGSGTEISGGSPAYARKPATWAASSGGSKALSGTYVFDMPPGTTAGFIGFESALSGGTNKGGFDITDETGAGQWTYTLTTGVLTL